MKRPPSRGSSGSSKKKSQKPPANVVELFPKSKKSKTPPEARTSTRPALRRESKRLSIHKRNLKSQVTRIRPRVNFGRRVWIAVLSGLSILIVLVGISVFSPLLAIEKIVLVGVESLSEKSILKDLDYLKGRPLPQVSNDEVTKKLSKYELIDSVSVVSVPPNTLKVIIAERTAIALVSVNGVNYRYDAVGVQLGRSNQSEKLPVILGAGNPGSSKSFTRAVTVILSLPVALLPKVESIRASSKDNVVLALRQNRQRVLWGDSSQPALKAKVLSALMKNYDDRVGLTFDVSSPNQPSVY